MNAYIVTETNNWDDGTSIVSIHSDLASALKSMKTEALKNGSYQQQENEDETYPWWESEEMMLEIEMHTIS